MKHIHAIVLTTLLIASACERGAVSSEESSAEHRAMMSAKETPPAGAMMMMSSANKVDFTTIDDARRLAAAGPTVLFFHADWCPLCRADMQQIDERLHELGNISVVVVDYDQSGGLKKQYGVTYQHTYVQIDADGQKIALWNGGGVDDILKNVVRGGDAES